MNENNDTGRRELILSSVECESPEIGVWLSALNDCRERTQKAIASIPNEALDWVCPLNRNTIGTLLYHIAAIELDWLYSEILEQEFPEEFGSWFPHDVRNSEGNLTAVVGENARQHEERLRYVRGRLLEALGTMSVTEFRRVRRLEAYDVTPQWVVHHLLQHEAEHRGQIGILRRRFEDLNAGLPDHSA